MQLYVGTSGFAYKQWRGAFYPEKTRADEMLAWYATRLNAVEINSTFYRFPTPAGVAGWAGQVPEQFRFAFKVPQRITHVRRLHDTDEDIGYLLETLASLGPRLGPLLFQLPPRMKPDLPALEDLTARIPPGIRIAFEFRNPDWLCDRVFALLQSQRCALCYNDTIMPTLRSTTDWGYLRLRQDHYSDRELSSIAKQVLSQPWCEAFVFFKHEAPGVPLLATRWAALADRMQHH